jgi:hypothetical protein
VSWHRDTAEKADRLQMTMQSGQLVELASVALALILARRVVPLDRLDVTEYGERAGYRTRKRNVMLQISRTEDSTELGRRHREKVSSTGHRIRFSKHPTEFRHGKTGR